MWYAMITMFVGLAIFSTITNEVFDFRVQKTVESMVENESDIVENALFITSRFFDSAKTRHGPHFKGKKAGLADEVFETCL